ncbi:MAG: 3-phosphoshikimate 1-carboxyvinyltransferase [Clostridia bacterium]|nr:3-phosphoshikimate 1-carboxyvinyltransferase [Clostridia bacterium]
MDIRIDPSTLNGTLPSISSKSDVHRLMICAALSDKPTVINNVSGCDDILATASCIEGLGAKAVFDGRTCTVTPSQNIPENPCFNCRESGSTLRFMLPVAAAVCGNAHFAGTGRLPERPIGELLNAMNANGTLFSSTHLPLDISGSLKAGIYTLPGNISSQYITGLLMALSVTKGESTIVLTSPLESASYVKMTLSTLKLFGANIKEEDSGYRIVGVERLTSPITVQADGDWSNAAFFLTSAAINGKVTLTGLSMDSPQGDKKIIQALKKFNAHVTIENDAVTVSSGELHGCETDLSDTPDMLPALAVLAAFAQGETRFVGAARLRLKESDRLKTVADMINSLGGTASVHEDGITVWGKPLKGGKADGANDHRIVMAAAIAAAHCTSSVEIFGAQAVNKSYPSFFEDFEALGGHSYVI